MVAFAVEFEDSVKIYGRVVFAIALSEAAVKLGVDEVERVVERGTIVVVSLEDGGEVVRVSATTDEEGDGVVVTDWFTEGLTS